MLWNEVLTNWENGNVLKYPRNIKGRFEWNTSVLKDKGESKFKQKFKRNDNLPRVQNINGFQEYITKSQNRYVVSFPNLNNDTMLVIPMPIHGKNYATLKDFIDNAPIKQQQEFWKHVAMISKKIINKIDKVWISVHGMGVHYTHVRISTKPKYYFDNKLGSDI